MWTQQLIDQLNLAHVARKDVKKTKQCRFQIREGSPEGIRVIMEDGNSLSIESSHVCCQ